MREARLEFWITLLVLFAAALTSALFGWLGARKPDPSRGPRLAPYRFLMLAFAAVVVMMAAHLVSLTGLNPGRPGGP